MSNADDNRPRGSGPRPDAAPAAMPATPVFPVPTTPAAQRWASDVIVDLMHRYELPYAALNPGASYRGLHDSIVNYGGNVPVMMLCQHEETAVQIAHGYAKASGKPMIAILHNLVGLLHANMAVYYAYIDRAPIFIVGATGPMDEGKRRPRIDWTHTAQVQGEAVRDYTKWDYQPTSIDGVPEAFARAYGVMMTEPQGPVYMCYDAWLQEQPLERDVPLPPASAAKVPARIGPDPQALARIADVLATANHPVILAEFVGRDPRGYEALVALAETLGAAVIDINSRLNFPGTHPLNLSMVDGAFDHADAILCLDVRDWEKPTKKLVSTTRELTSLVPEGCRWIEIGFGDLELSSWAMDYQRLLHADVRVLADTTLAIPMLTALLRERIERDAAAPARIRDALAGDRRPPSRSACALAGARARELGRLADHAAAPRERGVERDPGRGLGAHRQHPRRLDAQALGFRSSVPASRASRSARRRRSASRSASRSRIATRAGWWSTCSPTATSCSTRAPSGSPRSIASRCSS